MKSYYLTAHIACANCSAKQQVEVQVEVSEDGTLLFKDDDRNKHGWGYTYEWSPTTKEIKVDACPKHFLSRY